MATARTSTSTSSGPRAPGMSNGIPSTIEFSNGCDTSSSREVAAMVSNRNSNIPREVGESYCSERWGLCLRQTTDEKVVISGFSSPECLASRDINLAVGRIILKIGSNSAKGKGVQAIVQELEDSPLGTKLKLASRYGSIWKTTLGSSMDNDQQDGAVQNATTTSTGSSRFSFTSRFSTKNAKTETGTSRTTRNASTSLFKALVAPFHTTNSATAPSR
ncbi:expressed unknown protein [Seminavis robusta]|uniref:Uncharacterized protein n=1 Tax=Seminavis robusta TaxID=568900 RepID=A0A9N8DUB7_9STRA|nr:expressed unknown protein [Seminavis robusta]|eukprot:Sro363_g126870.1 n/a (218) ;mRNA; r:30066-30719